MGADGCLRMQPRMQSRNSSSVGGSMPVGGSSLRNLVVEPAQVQLLVAHLGLNGTEDLRSHTLVPKARLIDLIMSLSEQNGGPHCRITMKVSAYSFKSLVLKAESCLTNARPGRQRMT